MTQAKLTITAMFVLTLGLLDTGMGPPHGRAAEPQTDSETKPETDTRLESIHVRSVSFSPDGKLLASGGWDKTVQLCDVASGKVIVTSNTGYDVHSVSFSPGGKLLASAGYDCAVQLWDVASGKLIRTFTQQHSDVWSVNFSPDGKVLAFGGHEKTISLCDVATGKVLRTWSAGCILKSVSFSPDGKAVASGGLFGAIQLWDVSTGKEIRSFNGDDPGVESVSFSSDGRMLASIANDETMRLWEVDSGKEIRTFKGHQNSAGNSAMSFSPDGKVLATGGCERRVRLWEVVTGKEIRDFNDLGDGINCVRFSPDGTMLASASSGGVLIRKVPGRRGRVAREISLEAVKQCWSDLDSDDAPRAYAAIEAMTGSPERALSFLKTVFKPVKPVTPADETRINALVVDLDHNEFAVRQKADAELEKIGLPAVPMLRRALKSKLTSLEVRRRIERLVNRIDVHELTPDTLRSLRAVQVLEYLGTPEAKDLLELWADRPEARLTQEARASLQRLSAARP